MNLSNIQLFDEYLRRQNYSAYSRRRSIITYRDKYKTYGKYQFNTSLFGIYEKHFELNSNFDNGLYKEINDVNCVYIIYCTDITIYKKYNHDRNFAYKREKYKEKYGNDLVFDEDIYYELTLRLDMFKIDLDTQVITSVGSSNNTIKELKVFKLIYKNIFYESEMIFNRHIECFIKENNCDIKEFNVLDLIKR